MTGPALLVVAAVSLLALGCGGEGSSDPAPGDRGAVSRSDGSRPLCARLQARVAGRVRSAAATELSGLVLSRSQRRVLWAHNDSGDRTRIFALAPNGRLRAQVTVTGAAHVDWEDIATGPMRGPGDALYIGDIGDNPATRPEVVVYRVREPRLPAGALSAAADRMALRYPDGAHDAEALLVDPSSGALVVVTKDSGGIAGVYVAGRASPSSTTVMRRAGRVSLGTGEPITAGDLSADGRTVVLRTYDRAFVWSRRPGQPLASALRRRPCAARADLLAEGQGEALALTRDGRAFYTVPEGRRPPLRRYAPVR